MSLQKKKKKTGRYIKQIYKKKSSWKLSGKLSNNKISKILCKMCVYIVKYKIDVCIENLQNKIINLFQ